MSHGHELTDEQREIRELAARFADEVVAPRAPEWDREHRFPRDVFEQLGELGLMGVCVPEDIGGAGADFLSYVLVLEEISRGDAGVGVTLAVHTGAGTLPIVAHGTTDQAQRLVPPLTQGHEIAAFALTEPGSGSDASAMLARVDADGRLTGTKQWITNGSHAHVFTVFAKQDEGISAFVVRRGAAGFRVTREEEKMGLHSSSTADLAFDATPCEPLAPPGGGCASRSPRWRPFRWRRLSGGVLGRRSDRRADACGRALAGLQHRADPVADDAQDKGLPADAVAEERGQQRPQRGRDLPTSTMPVSLRLVSGHH